MKKLMEKLKEKGYKKVSLSVQKENYAFKFYESLGFKMIQENIDDCIMACELLKTTYLYRLNKQVVF